jgi:hypothetical protein
MICERTSFHLIVIIKQFKYQHSYFFFYYYYYCDDDGALNKFI